MKSVRSSRQTGVSTGGQPTSCCAPAVRVQGAHLPLLQPVRQEHWVMALMPHVGGAVGAPHCFWLLMTVEG